MEKLFENGDIIEVTQAPFKGVYYGIYLYNKNDENPHSILAYGRSGYSCFGIKNLDQISKVKKCPEDKINILSERSDQLTLIPLIEKWTSPSGKRAFPMSRSKPLTCTSDRIKINPRTKSSTRDTKHVLV